MKQHKSRYFGKVAVCMISATVAFAQQQRGDWWGHGPMGPNHMWSERMPGWGHGNMGPGQQ